MSYMDILLAKKLSGGGGGGGGGGSTVVEEKEVNFIDYDGTILYSYNYAQLANLTELPANPEHNGLVAQGWNWSLEDAKTYASTHKKLWIGQTYITDDEKTRIYCTFNKGTLSPYLGICVNGTVTVDWGDGSATSSVTGNSLGNATYTQHTYAAAGDYVITIKVESGSFAIKGGSYGSYLIAQTTSDNEANKAFCACINKIELGKSVDMSAYALCYCTNLETITLSSSVTCLWNYGFQYCSSLKSITMPASATSILQSACATCTGLTTVSIPNTVASIDASAFKSAGITSLSIPNSVTTISQSAFQYCTALRYVGLPSGITSIDKNVFNGCYALTEDTIPDTLTSIGSSAFYDCRAFRNVEIPSGVTTIGNGAFRGCSGLASVTIPASVTSIANYTFYMLNGLQEVHLLPTTPPTIQSSTFSSSTTAKFYVPAGTLATYQAASEWSTFASLMVEE